MKTELQDIHRCGLPENQGSLSTNGSHKAFHRVDVYFMKAITVIIPHKFATAVTDACVRIAPLFQTAINVVLVRVNTGTWHNCRFDQRLDRPLLDVFQHPNHHLTTTLDHPEDRGLLRGKCAASAFPSESSAPAPPPFFSTSSGFPLCPATIETSSHSTSSVHVGEGFVRTMPWRH